MNRSMLWVGVSLAFVLVLVGAASATSLQASINEPLFINAICNGANATAEITVYSGTTQNPDNLYVPRTAMDQLSDSQFEYVVSFSQKGTYTAWMFCDYAGGFEVQQQADITVTDPQNLITESTYKDYEYEADLFYNVYFQSEALKNRTVDFETGNNSLAFKPVKFGLAQLDANNGQVKDDGHSNWTQPKNVSGIPIGNTFVYQALYGDGIDLQYLVNSKYVKEEVVVNDFASLPAPSHEILDHLKDAYVVFNSYLSVDNATTFWINGKKWDMKATVKTNKTVVLTDARNNTIYRLEIPVVFDSDGNKVVGSYTFTHQAPIDKIKYTVQIASNMPYAWFRDPARVYPVYIDPTVDTPDGTGVFGAGMPYINVSDATIPAEQPYTVSEMVMLDANTPITDAECEMNLINNSDSSYTIFFRSFYNDGNNGTMTFAMDGVNAWLPEPGSFTLEQYCWRGNTLSLNKIFANSTITVQ